MRQPPIVCEAWRIASTSACAVESPRSSRSFPAAPMTSPRRTTTAPIGTSSWSAARSASRRASRMNCSSRPKKRPSAMTEVSGLLDAGRATDQSQAGGWRAAAPLDSGRADDVDAAGGVVGDLVRHAAEQEALRAGHPLVADHDQVRLDLLGDVQDRVGGIPLPRVALGFDPMLLRHADGAVERHVDVLPRANRVRDVSRRLTLLLAQAGLGNRLEGGHDFELRPRQLGELDRLANRLGRRVGAVCANHYALEHWAHPILSARRRKYRRVDRTTTECTQNNFTRAI